MLKIITTFQEHKNQENKNLFDLILKLAPMTVVYF